MSYWTRRMFILSLLIFLMAHFEVDSYTGLRSILPLPAAFCSELHHDSRYSAKESVLSQSYETVN